MKVLCTETHIRFKDGKLDLQDDETKTTMLMLMNQLERMIRIQIHNEICDIKLTENRSQIVKNGIDNVALTVQDLCAKVALGTANESSN